MADAESTAVVIASALSTIAAVVQAMWANHKGKKREPRQGRMEEKLDKLIAQSNDNTAKIEANSAKIDDLKEHFDERHNNLGARVERVERAQRKSGGALDDTEVGDKAK